MRLKRVAPGQYNVSSAYIGTGAPLFPYQKKAEPHSEIFWANHALIIDKDVPIVPETIHRGYWKDIPNLSRR